MTSKSGDKIRLANSELSELEYLVAEDMIEQDLDPFDVKEIQEYWKARLDD